jgi:hypothetical protein
MERTFYGASLLRTAGRVFVLAALAGSVACGGCKDDPPSQNNPNTNGEDMGGGDDTGPEDMGANNLNNPMGSITVAPTTLQINENGGTGTFSISLAVEPDADVTINLVSGDESEATVAPAQVTFTAANFAAAQTITVTGVDDPDIDGTQSITIATNVVGTGNYVGIDAADVTVDVLDDDAADGSVQPTAVTVFEGGAGATFSVSLSAMPTGPVTIPISVSDATEITTDVTSLTFDATNFATAQVVTVDAIDDQEVEPPLTLSVIVGAASGGGYDGIDLDDVGVTLVDDDQPVISVSPSILTTNESGTSGTFTVALGSAPSDTVTIDVTSGDATEGSVAPAVLTFTAANFNVAQTVTVTGLDDTIVDGAQTYQVTMVATSNDTAYDGLTIPAVAVTNNDNDNIGVLVSPTLITVNEAGATSANFTIALATDPGETVTVDLLLTDTTEATLSTAQLTFDSGNFATPQTVTVTAIDDTEVDGNSVVQVTTTMNATLAYLNAPVNDVTVTVLDNDQAGITVAPTSGLTTTEAGGSATFTVVLNAQPTANVTIALTSSDPTEGTVAPASVTFTPGTWSTAQTVTVTGVDDFSDDGNQTFTIVTAPAVSTDMAFNNLNAQDVLVVNQDDDTAGFIVNPTTGLRTSEGGGQATFTVALTTPPSANVNIPIQSTDTTEGTVSPMSLTFTPADWATPQTVTVTGVQDSLTDGPVVYIVVLDSTTSMDSAYNNLDPPNVTLTNDDDEAGFAVTPQIITVSESGANNTATFQIRLNSPPTQNVRIDLNPDGLETFEYNVTPQQFVFTPANWLTPQTATVTGVPDTTIDGTSNWSISVFVASTIDANYAGNCAGLCPPKTVDGTTTDSDSVGVTVSPTEFTVIEGNCQTVTITLNTNAVSTLSFTASLADTTTIANNQLRFTTPNGAGTTRALTIAAGTTSTSVVVCGFDDIIAENQKTEPVTLSAFTAAGGMTDPYNAMDPQDLNATIEDDDTPGLLVRYENPLGVGNSQNLWTTELCGDGNACTIFDSVFIRLATPPSTSVVVTFTTSDPTEAEVSDGLANTGTSIALVFQPSDWNTEQQIQAVAKDDLLFDGNQNWTFNITVTSVDTFYNNLAVSPINGITSDDDSPGWALVPLVTPLETGEAAAAPDAHYIVLQNTASNDTVQVGVSISPITEAQFQCFNWGCTSNGTTATMTYPANFPFAAFVRFRVTGVDDAIIDGPQTWAVAQTSLVTTDPFYVATTFPTATGINTDDDTVGIIITNLTSDMDEDDSDGFNVRLASQPSANVTVTVNTSDATEATITSGTTLTFTPTNFGNQPVTISGVEDMMIDGDIDIFVNATAASTDTNYNGQTGTAPITINDIDQGDLDFDTGGAIVTNESGTSHIVRVRLTSIPTANVTIPVYSFDTTEATVSPGSLVFTPTNWNVYQNVTITGVDDVVQDGNQNFVIWFDIPTSADPAYDGLPPVSFTGTNNDNDTVGVTIIQPTNPNFLVTDEDGTADTFQVVLNTAPAAGTSVRLLFGASGGVCAAMQRCVITWPSGVNASGLGTISPTSVTFTPANWSTPQTVTVTGANNSGTTRLSWYRVPVLVDTTLVGRDTAYDGVFVEQVLGVSVDNDDEAIVVFATPVGTTGASTTPSIDQNLFTSETGSVATLWVRLTELPTANVTLNFTFGAQVTAASSFTITQSNYNQLNPIAVTGVDDGNMPILAGFTNFTFTVDGASTDPDYDTATAVVLQGRHIDNDNCRLVLFPQTTNTANGRIDGQFGPQVGVPYAAMIGANPPTLPVQTTLVYTGGVVTNNTALTFSNGGQPSTLYAYGTTDATNFQVNFAVALGDSCYTTSPTQILFGRSN